MQQARFVSLSTPLRAFREPDTQSPVEARLPAATYPVLDVKEGTASTYVAVRSALSADGSSWVCIRSGAKMYGTLFTHDAAPAARAPFSGDAHAIAESALVASLKAFVGWGYDLHHPRYPKDLGAVALPKAPPRVNNCCSFVEALVVDAFALAWDVDRHGEMMIDSAADWFSPVTALLGSGAAVPAGVDELAPPSPWTVFQGWRTQWGGGHTFIAVDHHFETDKVLVLESNCTADLNGVGWRGIGKLAADALAPKEWWTLPGVWAWERIMSTYPFRRRCMLRVRDRKLSTLG